MLRGIWGDPELLYIEVAGVKRPLAGPWKIGLGLVTVNSDGSGTIEERMLMSKMVIGMLEGMGDAFKVEGEEGDAVEEETDECMFWLEVIAEARQPRARKSAPIRARIE